MCANGFYLKGADFHSKSIEFLNGFYLKGINGTEFETFYTFKTDKIRLFRQTPLQLYPNPLVWSQATSNFIFE